MTLTIQIGNSDDKLTQARWAEFVRRVDSVVQAVIVETFSLVMLSGARKVRSGFVLACGAVRLLCVIVRGRVFLLRVAMMERRCKLRIGAILSRNFGVACRGVMRGSFSLPCL